MAKKGQSEKIKLIALAGLGGVMLLIFVYQFFFSDPPPKPQVQANNNAASSTSRGGTTVTTPEAAERAAKRQTDRQMEQAELDALLQDMSPLDMRVIKTSGPATVGERGNVFDYYIPPPPPKQPDPPPPPITLVGLQPQSATAGTPRSFTLTVFGRGFPADAQVIFDGRVRATKRINDTTLTTEIAPVDYAAARPVNIEVKSQSEPAKFYSNSINFVASQAPEPPFKFIGILGEMAILEMNTRVITRVAKGNTIEGVWRIDAISTQAIDVTQTQFDIKKRVPLQEKGR
jgi:hypothetical protein